MPSGTEWLVQSPDALDGRSGGFTPLMYRTPGLTGAVYGCTERLPCRFHRSRPPPLKVTVAGTTRPRCILPPPLLCLIYARFPPASGPLWMQYSP